MYMLLQMTLLSIIYIKIFQKYYYDAVYVLLKFALEILYR